MFSGNAESKYRTAAWRITFGGVLVFAIGSAIAFLFLQQFLVHDLQHRADSWLVGELGVLADVAERTPNDRLHDTVVREVAELASREAPRDSDAQPADRSVFFLITTADGAPILHTGAGGSSPALLASLRSAFAADALGDVAMPGFNVPFRVAKVKLASGPLLYLGLSSHYERQVLHKLRVRFAIIWLVVIGLGGSILFFTTRRMLQRVEKVSDAAATIGRNNLSTRVPVGARNDEISLMAHTFNQMLDRIQSTVQQMNTMSDAIAHDLRSPLTAIRGRLEMMLTSRNIADKDTIPSVIEDLDRLSNLLSVSLDISEANANALRVHRAQMSLSDLLSNLVRLYEPMLNDAGVLIESSVTRQVTIDADPTLMERVLMNLFENALKHLGSGNRIQLTLSATGGTALLEMRDTGPGFPAELLPVALEPFTRGYGSSGSGLGLAFVAAVLRMHEGTVRISNVSTGGACILLQLPCSTPEAEPEPEAFAGFTNA